MRPVVANHRVELNYLADLMVVVEACRRAGEEVGAGLKVHWDESSPATDARRRGADAPPPPPGAPLPDAPSLNVLLEQAARRFGNIDAVAERLANLAAQRALGAVDEALAENILKAVGVDISSYVGPNAAPTPEDLRKIRAAMAEAVESNVALIKSIPEQYLASIRETVNRAFVAGERFESVAERIQHVGDVTETRARTIARDQVSKMNASFNEARQVSVGITHYTWSTSHDERVRPSHAELNGKDFAWKDPPEVEGERVHPGEAILCRCVAIPVLNVAEEPGGGEAEERQAA